MQSAALKKTNQRALKENERKWGQPLIKAGWSLLPATILDKQQELSLTAADINIIMHLVRHWWYSDRLPYPSKARLAALMGIHPSTVQRRIRRMEKMGLIQRIPQKDPDRGQKSNQYDLSGLVRKATPMAKAALVEREKRDAERSKRKAPTLRVVHGVNKPR